MIDVFKQIESIFDRAAPRPQRIRLMPESVCSYCDQLRPARLSQLQPYHDASDRCESGKRPHCTCDICF